MYDVGDRVQIMECEIPERIGAIGKVVEPTVVYNFPQLNRDLEPDDVVILLDFDPYAATYPGRTRDKLDWTCVMKRSQIAPAHPKYSPAEIVEKFRL